MGRRFAELAASRTGQAPMQEKVIFTLLHWHTHGRNSLAHSGM